MKHSFRDKVLMTLAYAAVVGIIIAGTSLSEEYNLIPALIFAVSLSYSLLFIVANYTRRK